MNFLGRCVVTMIGCTGIGYATNFSLKHLGGGSLNAKLDKSGASCNAPTSDVVDQTTTLSADEVSQMEEDIVRLPLSSEESQLLLVAETNPWERKLKLATLAARHERELPKGPALGLTYLKEMIGHPEESMRAVSSLAPKLDPDHFAVDRASLLDVAARLPGQTESARALAINELQSVILPETPNLDTATNQEEVNRILSTNEKSFIPITAFEILLKTTPDAEDAFSEAVKAVQAQKDPGLRNNFATKFVEKYPEYKDKMISALVDAGTKPDEIK